MGFDDPDQRLRWSGSVWAWEDLNLRPHPYQLNAGNRCAEARLPWLLSTVGRQGIRSIGALVCVQPPWRLHALAGGLTRRWYPCGDGSPAERLAATRSMVLTDADVDFADRGRRLQLRGLAGEVEGGCGVRWIQFTEAAHGLAGRQRLYGHAPLLQLLDRVGIGPHAAVGAGAHDQVRRKLVQNLNQVVEHQRVAVSAPPVPHHPVGQDDEVLGLLAPS